MKPENAMSICSDALYQEFLQTVQKYNPADRPAFTSSGEGTAGDGAKKNATKNRESKKKKRR